MTTDRYINEEYQGFRLKYNRVPDAQFDFSFGFGWACQVFVSGAKEPHFQVVIKSLNGERSSDRLDRAFSWLKQTTQELIASDSFEANALYCFQWEPDLTEKIAFSRVDCDSIGSPMPR